MKIYSICFLATLLLLASCNNQNHGNSDSIYEVNLERDIANVSSPPLSHLGSELEYIPLETDSACLIHNISNVFVSDSFLFVSDNNRLLLFNRSGKFIRKIGSNGRGPGEYSRIADFVVEKKDKEVYVLSGRIVLVYDFYGQFKRDFKLGFLSSQFVLNENNELILHPYNFPQASDKTIYSWYILNKKGKDRTKIPNTLKRVNGGITIPISPLYMYNGTLHFMEFGIDTLYSFENQEKKPHAVFHYGNLKFPPDPTIDEAPKTDGKFYIISILETKKSIFIKICYLFPNYSISNCVFDKSTSEFSVLNDDGFSNDIDGGLAFWPQKIMDDNTMIDFSDAFDLIKYYKNKKSGMDATKSDELEKVVKNLTETSNPVIIVLKTNNQL